MFDPQVSNFWLIVMDVYNSDESGQTTKRLLLTSFALEFCRVRTVQLVTVDGQR